MEIIKGNFPIKNKKKSYVIYKNSQYFEMFWDACEGYSLICEEIRGLKKRYPKEKWEQVEYSEHLKNQQK